ncbi:MAG: FHA domain-containing protein, partial [Pseudomonadota bacterium]
MGNLKAPDSEPFKLEEETLRIGRSMRADIQIAGFDCSRIHATLVRQQDDRGRSYYVLHDGDLQAGKQSANGTFVNGRQIKRYRLGHGDRILFG